MGPSGPWEVTSNNRLVSPNPIGSMYGIYYANIGGIWMVNVTIYSIHGSYGYGIDVKITDITGQLNCWVNTLNIE